MDFEKATPISNNPPYNVYVGARYVPLFDGEWVSTKKYEPLTVVGYQGDTYTSKTFVPAGIPVTNENYWAQSGNYNAQVEEYRQNVVTVQNNLTTLQGTVNTNKAAADEAFDSINSRLGTLQTQVSSFSASATHPFYKKRVLWVGDSITDPDASGFGRELTKWMSDTGGTLTNIAKSGDGIMQQLDVVKTLNMFNYDAVGVLIGTNNIGSSWPNKNDSTHGNFIDQMRQLLVKLNASHPSMFVCGLLYRKDAPAIAFYNMVIQNLCKQLCVPYIALDNVPTLNYYDKSGLSDNVHPTDQAGRKKLFPYIMEGIASRGIVCHKNVIYDYDRRNNITYYDQFVRIPSGVTPEILILSTNGLGEIGLLLKASSDSATQTWLTLGNYVPSCERDINITNYLGTATKFNHYGNTIVTQQAVTTVDLELNMQMFDYINAF